MEKKIYKYPLKIADIQIVLIPKFAKILNVMVQNQMPVLYAQVDPESPPIETEIEIFGTGEAIPDFITEEGAALPHREFIGSFIVYHEDIFVGHVFKVKRHPMF